MASLIRSLQTLEQTIQYQAVSIERELNLFNEEGPKTLYEKQAVHLTNTAKLTSEFATLMNDAEKVQDAVIKSHLNSMQSRIQRALSTLTNRASHFHQIAVDLTNFKTVTLPILTKEEYDPQEKLAQVKKFIDDRSFDGIQPMMLDSVVGLYAAMSNPNAEAIGDVMEKFWREMPQPELVSEEINEIRHALVQTARIMHCPMDYIKKDVRFSCDGPFKGLIESINDLYECIIKERQQPHISYSSATVTLKSPAIMGTPLQETITPEPVCDADDSPTSVIKSLIQLEHQIKLFSDSVVDDIETGFKQAWKNKFNGLSKDPKFSVLGAVPFSEELVMLTDSAEKVQTPEVRSHLQSMIRRINNSLHPLKNLLCERDEISGVFSSFAETLETAYTGDCEKTIPTLKSIASKVNALTLNPAIQDSVVSVYAVVSAPDAFPRVVHTELNGIPEITPEPKTVSGEQIRAVSHAINHAYNALKNGSCREMLNKPFTVEGPLKSLIRDINNLSHAIRVHIMGNTLPFPPLTIPPTDSQKPTSAVVTGPNNRATPGDLS